MSPKFRDIGPQMAAKIVPLTIARPYSVILATFFVVLCFCLGLPGLYLDKSHRVYFGKDNPELLAFEAMEDIYSKNDSVLIVLAPADTRVFTVETLSVVKELTKKCWTLPYSTRVDSIANFQHTQATGDLLSVRDLVPDRKLIDRQRLAAIKNVALEEPLLVNKLVSQEGTVTAVNVTIQIPHHDYTAGTPHVVDQARAIVRDFRQRYPDIKFYLTGMAVMNNAFGEASQGDLKLIAASFGLMAIVLGILMLSATATVITLAIAFCSIAIAMGFAGYMNYPITPPTATAPLVVLTLVVANCAHILITVLYGLRRGVSNEDSLLESLSINFQPVLLASTTTALGFLSMNFSEVPPFNHLGNIVAVGVLASLVLSMLLLPALVVISPMRERVLSADRWSPMATLARLVIGNRRFLLVTMTVVVFLCILAIPKNELNDVFLNYFDPSITFRADSDFTIRNITGLYTIDYSIDSGTPGGINEPAFLTDLESMASWLREQPEVIHVASYSDTISRLNKNLHSDNPDWNRIPESRDLAAQYLLLYELSLPFGLGLNNQISVDKSSLRLTVSTQTLSSNAVIAFNDRVELWVRDHAASVESVTGSGTTLMFANIGHRNITSMLIGTTAALIAVSVLLMFVFRSVKIGIISLIPNLIPAVIGFGLWGLFVGEVGISLSVVTAMTFGIVIDDTIHLLSKYLRARRQLGLNAEQSIRSAYSAVGKALIVTTTVLVAGFGLLATSDFYLNASMGMLTAIIIFSALVADFFMFGPLLMKFDRGDAPHE